MDPLRASILTIGTEVSAGQIVNSNEENKRELTFLATIFLDQLPTDISKFLSPKYLAGLFF